MARLILHKTPNPEARSLERHIAFAKLSPEEKMKKLCHLIELSFSLGGRNHLKKPQGKGLIIKRP